MTPIHRLVILAGFVLLAGCATLGGSSGPVRYYHLSLPPLSSAPADPGSIRGRLLIGPVEVADHLDRSQLVTQSGPNRLAFNELDQWAGSLAGQVEQVLLRHLANRLGAEAVLAYPAEADRPADRRLRIRVLDLAAGPGNRARLSLFWQASAARQADRHGLESFEQPIEVSDVPGMNAIVSAYDELLAQAAERIATHLRRRE